MTCNRIVILAAGRATRMRSSAAARPQHAQTTEALSRPKPMMRVGPNGEPMLQLILEQALRAGFTEATVVLTPSDTITPSFLAKWNEGVTGERMRLATAVQPEPKGTGHAVLCALEQDAVAQGEAFVLCNGDNLPTSRALAQLRIQPEGQALLAFDRAQLGLSAEKTFAFAVIESQKGKVRRIVEKPDEALVHQLAQQGSVRVSMNLFRLSPEWLLPRLQSLKPHPDRGEMELPAAVQAMVDDGLALEPCNVAEPVLDLTRLNDVASVQNAHAFLPGFELEVCASSPSDVQVAADAGAHRVELCAHWECGGLTPTESDVRMACAAGLPIHALIRCRAGHFVYTESEKELMTRQIEAVLKAGASRAVVGGLLENGQWDAALIQHWTQEFGAHRLVIHRAFDACSDWEGAAEHLAECGVRRILTSGGAPQAWDGQDRIKQLVEMGFDATVGSGVVPGQRAEWLKLGVNQFHASCRTQENVSTALFDGTVHRVDPERVRAWFAD